MYVEKVNLENFRNYSSCEVCLKPHLNIFKGDNAQGKTNFLESLYLSGIGKSPKTTREKDLILWGKDRAKIFVKIKKKYFEQTIETHLTANVNKSIKINGLNIRKIGDLIGELPIVYFSPEEIGLIKDGPIYRRRFMDIDISQINKNYFYLLCRYEKVLNERNKLLKETKKFENLADTIDIWDEQLSKIASEIIFYRLDFIEKIESPAREVHAKITSNEENLEVKYQGLQTKNTKEIYEKLLQLYKKNLKKDYDLGYTTIGPHRDDLEIKVNGIDIRNFGSQGQQRLATLSLKIAELVLFEKVIGEKPLLLLDDVLSELDNKRCKNLLVQIKDYQTILTTTKFSRKVDDQSAIFEVKNANIKQIM